MPPVEPSAPVAVDPSAILAHDGGKLKPYRDDDAPLLHLFGALLGASPLLEAVLRPAIDFFADGVVVEPDLLDLMFTFGVFLMPGEPVQSGDLVGEGDGAWALAAGPAVGLVADGQNGVYSAGGISEQPLHWRPSTGLIVDPASRTGQYWGPAMWRYRHVLQSMQSATYQVAEFVSDVVDPLALPVDRTALLRTLSSETQAVDETPLIRPGTILLDDDPDRAGLVVADTGLCRACGLGGDPLFRFTDVEGSGCDWLWVPHLA